MGHLSERNAAGAFARAVLMRLPGWDCQLHALTIELRDNAAWVRRRILQPEDPEIVKVDRREHRREIRVEKDRLPDFSSVALECPSMTKL